MPPWQTYIASNAIRPEADGGRDCTVLMHTGTVRTGQEVEQVALADRIALGRMTFANA